MRVWEHIKQGVGARNLNSYELVQAEQSWIDDLFAWRSEIPVYSFLYLTRLCFDLEQFKSCYVNNLLLLLLLNVQK